jgi:hypothetical protein
MSDGQQPAPALFDGAATSASAAAPAPAPAATPAIAEVVAPAPAVETTPASAPASTELHPVDVPSLLEDAGKKPNAKAEKAPKTDAAAEAPAPAPTPELAAIEWDFKLPETLKADDATIGQLRENLTSLLRPKEGETPSHAAQRLLDMHANAIADYAKQVDSNQRQAWNNVRKEWRTQALADEMIGGAGHDTAMGVVARVRDSLISEAKPGTAQYKNDVKEVQDFLRITGAGDHPAFLKMLYRAGRYVDEAPAPKFTGSPPPDAGRKPGRRLYSDEGSR